MSGNSFLSVQQVTAGYWNQPVLRDINWEIQQDQNWVITGLMNAGKTCLARSLTGKVQLIKGKIKCHFLKEQSTNYELRRKAIRMTSFSDNSKLFRSANAVHYYQQRYNAFDHSGHLTTGDYLRKAGYDAEDPVHREIVRHLALDPLMNRERIKLSSGETRKMLIAKALLSTPALLVIDNPYLGLDAASRATFNGILDRLAREKGIKIILSGHYRHLPDCIQHRLHLHDGRAVARGGIKEIENKLSPVADQLDADCLEEIKYLFRQQGPDVNYQSVLSMKDVSVSYDHHCILNKINWEVLPGEKWSLVGPNGSGKSTLLSLIYGDNPQAYANCITLFDRKRGSGESIWDIKKRIGFSSSEIHAYFNYNYNARDIVLSGLWDGFVKRKVTSGQLAFARLLFRFFNAEKFFLIPFSQLSTGMQRLSFFLRALIKCPKVLLLDEPFQGLDENSMQKCRILLQEILTEQHTLIFITHYEHEIPENVDRIFRLPGR